MVILYGIESLDKYILDSDEEAEEQVEPQVSEVGRALLYFAFKAMGFLMFAVLPAIGKGGLLAALLTALIFSASIEATLYITNFSLAKQLGIKRIIVQTLLNIIATEIIAAGSYYIALFMLA